MKEDKIFLILSVVLLVLAILCLAVGIWFRMMYGSVMDGTASLYARLNRLYQIFLWLGAGLFLAGGILFAMRRSGQGR